MGSTIKSTPVTFVHGEEIVKRCDYLDLNGKDVHRDAALILTNRRLIHLTYESRKHVEANSLLEIPVEDIDSVDYSVMKRKKRVPIPPLIIAFLLLVIAVTCFVLSKSEVFQKLVFLGIVALVLSIAIILLVFLLRKWTSSFYLRVYSHKSVQDHLAIGNVAPVAQQSAQSQRRVSGGLIVALVFFNILCACGMSTLLAFFMRNMFMGMGSGYSSGTPNVLNNLLMFIAPLVGVMVVMIIINSIFRSRVRASSRARIKVSSAAHSGANVIRVAINDGQVKEFLNQCGALIEDAKANLKLSENKGE